MAISRTYFNVRCSKFHKDEIYQYIEKNCQSDRSRVIVDLALKAIALNKTKIIDIPYIGINTSFCVSCQPEEKTAIKTYCDKNKINRSRWLVSLIYTDLLKLY